MDELRDEINAGLLPLPDKARILFSIAIGERLYPNYVAFQEIYHWGDHTILRDAIGLMRQYVKGNRIEAQEISKAIQKVEAITPATENFPKLISGFALDACNAVRLSLTYLLDKQDTDYIAHAASIARDTVDIFVEATEGLKWGDPLFYEKMYANKFMIRELTAQRELLKNLAVIDLEKITDQWIDALIDKDAGIDLTLLK